MAVKYDYKARIGSFIGWVVTLAILGTMGYYIFLAVNTYQIGRQSGDKAGHAFIEEYGGVRGALFENGLKEFIRDHESHMKNDWKGKLYQQGFEDGMQGVTGPYVR